MQKICIVCGNIFIKKQNESKKYWERKKYCSKKCVDIDKKGKPNKNSGCFKKGVTSWNKGLKGRKPWNIGISPSEETKEKIRQKLLGIPQPWHSGEKSNFWKGGKTEWRKQLQNSIEYRVWRRKVFERDNWTCQKCGDKNYQGRGKSLELHPHHIKPVSKFPNLLTEISNGITLCRNCHRLTDSWGRQEGSKNKS